MIGSGIFLLPAALAKYGAISLIGWVISGLGGLVIANVFSTLSKHYPKSGGPYEFAKQGFGNFVGFLVAWGYWIAIVTTNAAIVVTIIGYLSVFFPILGNNVFVAIATGLAIIWFLTYINCRGIKEAGFIQLSTTILKLIPLFFIGLVGLFFLEFEHFTPMNLSGESSLSAITVTTTLTLFAFLGIESATIPADNIENPKFTIPKATKIGIWVTLVVYILGTVAVMGIVPPEVLASSEAPFADAAAQILGEPYRKWISLGVVISTFGALNGWIMIQGQIPPAAAKDNLFPNYFGKINKRDLPVGALIISSGLISLLLFINYSKSFIEVFEFMILLSTLTCLVPYLFAAATHVLLSFEKGKKYQWVWGALAFLFSLWAVIGSGQETVYWGFLLLMAGIPIYVWKQKKGNSNF